MTYNIKMRERCLRDILVDMKARLDSENDIGLEIEFEKNINWQGQEFEYKFFIFRPSTLTSIQYDKYVELKNFVNEMFRYLLNPDTIDICFFEDDDKCEFQITSKING